MKRFQRLLTITSMILLILFFFSSHTSAADQFDLDVAHSYINFKVVHLGMGNSYGRFNSIKGALTMEGKALESITITVDADQVDSNNAKRDKHIKSPDFFNASKYPTISFKSKSVKKREEDTFNIQGTLTFLGKSRPLTVTAKQIGFGKDPWGKIRTGFETTFSINRSDFGNTFMMKGLSDEVIITVSIEAIKK